MKVWGGLTYPLGKGQVRTIMAAKTKTTGRNSSALIIFFGMPGCH